jgi:hypothetical protein
VAASKHKPRDVFVNKVLDEGMNAMYLRDKQVKCYGKDCLLGTADMWRGMDYEAGARLQPVHLDLSCSVSGEPEKRKCCPIVQYHIIAHTLI